MKEKADVTIDLPDQTKRVKHICFLLAFAAIWLFLLWKCQYGFADMDESFYLTTSLRILDGDALLFHEWNLSQMSSFLLTPLVWLYSIFRVGTEGILLWFRYAFTAIWGLTALFLAYRLKEKSLIGAAVASLAFMIYTPYGIMSLSYNSLGLLLMCVSMAVLATNDGNKPIWYSLSGLLFAGAVLCCPYLLGLYLLFFVTALISSRMTSAKALFVISAWEQQHWHFCFFPLF